MEKTPSNQTDYRVCFPHLCQDMFFERQVAVDDNIKIFFAEDMLKRSVPKSIIVGVTDVFKFPKR